MSKRVLLRLLGRRSDRHTPDTPGMALQCEMEDTGVANSPMRPPTYRAGRRPPKGTRRVTRPMRDRLKTAASLLRQDGHDEAATDVEAVLAPGGWTLLRAKDAGTSGTATNLPLTIDKDLRDALKAKAGEFGVTLGAVVADGYRQVLAGEWAPPKVKRTSTEKVVLNVRVDSVLQEQVNAQAARLTQEAGYRVTKSSIAIAWMAEELGVEGVTVEPTQPAE